MRSPFLWIPILLVAALTSACGRHCRLAKTRVLEPTQWLATYLEKRPDGAELASTGCPRLIPQIDSLPQGAATLRRLAEQRFAHERSECVDWREEYRYRCYPGTDPRKPPVCYRELYRFCAHWAIDSAQNPGYTRAMELSRKVDRTYALAHTLCGHALSGRRGDANLAARELFHFLVTDVQPESEAIYAQACPSRG